VNINYNLISLFDLLALVQGIILSVILISGDRKNRPSLLLGLFLLTYTLELTDSILTDTNIINQYPVWSFLPFNFYFLSLPLLYLYTKNLISPVSLKKHWLILIPGTLEFLGFVVLFFMPVAVKEWLNVSWAMLAYMFLGVVYSIYFAVLTFKIVRHHQVKALDYFSEIEGRHLKWIKAVAVFIIAFYTTYFTLVHLPYEALNKYTYSIGSFINVLFIYWVGISGLRQTTIEMNVVNGDEISEKDAIIPSPTPESNGEDNIYEKLLQLMEEKKPHKQVDLTLATLARQMRVSSRILSQAINQNAGTNFNRFINQYRVEEAKKIIANSEFDYLNMTGVAKEAGFNSDSSFFTTFKKLTGTTPSNFKKSIPL
jgi:AraC-like DNA-binding protein